MTSEFEAPLKFEEQKVLPEWVDFNGHMNVAFYLMAFDRCVDQMYNRLGIGPAQLDQTRCSVFTVEAHINYLREVVEGDPLKFDGRLMDYDNKRIHTYFEMFHDRDGHIVAAMEQVGIHVDLKTRKTTPFSAEAKYMLQSMKSAHDGLPEAGHSGRVIGISHKRDA